MRHAILGLVLTAVLVAAPPERAAADQVTQFSLANGMDVVVIEDHRSPAVTHMMWYRVGAADEQPGVSGLAHLFEHLMFKGTRTHPPGAFSDFVRANGGSDNAFTSWDYTAYFQRVSRDLLAEVMEFEADRMTNLIVDAAQTATELQVVQEERAQRVENNPRALFREQARAAQYLNHPYGRPIIGWPNEVAALTDAEARAFYEQHYAPNNAILVVAGDVLPDEVRELAQAHYGAIPANPDLRQRARPPEPPQLAARHVVYTDPRVAQPTVSRSYLAPERNAGAQDEAAALTLLANLLGGDPATSFLGRRLQFDSNLAIYAGAWYRGMSLDDTTFSLSVVPSPGVSLAEAEAALDAALDAFMEEGVDSDQLARLKRQYVADAIYRRDDVGSLAREYGAALTSGLTIADVQAWPEAIATVTEADIMAAARDVFVPERSVTGWLQQPEMDAEVTQ